MNYIELNNQVIIRDENGKYQLNKDKEALKSYLEDYIEPRMRKFNNLKERLDYLEDLEDESPKDKIENDIDDLEDLLEILSTNGKVQYKIKGGERIFSRKNTRVLIRQAKKAEKLKTDSAYKRLGKSVFKYMKIQDNNDPEYVNTEKHG